MYIIDLIHAIIVRGTTTSLCPAWAGHVLQNSVLAKVRLVFDLDFGDAFIVSRLILVNLASINMSDWRDTFPVEHLVYYLFLRFHLLNMTQTAGHFRALTAMVSPLFAGLPPH